MENILNFFGRKITPEVRKLSEMKEVVYDREWLKKAKNFDVYYMYRNLAKNEEDRKKFLNAKVRYDITIIPKGMLGCEYVKTLGHYHPLTEKKISYPEIYEVLEGKAHYLLQKLSKGKVEDVVLIEAKKRDVVLIPPNYGHVTINPSNKNLKMANLVSTEFSSIYEPIKKKKGAAYFELKKGWVKNENYGELPDIRNCKPLQKNFNLSIYDEFMKNPKKFEFLRKPWLYPDLFRFA
ncbi:MAG: glucose-6-phosphate isomerase family protein [Candidatus Altiarchaeota archaeon]